jgi:adenosylcobinamide kinase/adenosylcobinamide-phosphate guanylyltransferase
VALTFITGPVRSGKSRFAERLARESGLRVSYLATALRDPDDAEWEARIARHVAERPPEWRTLETAERDTEALAALVRALPSDECVLLDSLGTWLAARMSARLAREGERAAQDARALESEAVALAEALLACRATVLVVGEETGWSVVPEYPAGRVFRDVLGRLQQRLATGAERAYLVVSGFALDLGANAQRIEPRRPPPARTE